MITPKIPLQITAGSSNGSASPAYQKNTPPNLNGKQPEGSFKPRWPQRATAYQAEQGNQENLAQDKHAYQATDEEQDYDYGEHADDPYNYYATLKAAYNTYVQDQEEPMANFAIMNYTCNICQAIFPFNNKLHQHVRSRECRQKEKAVAIPAVAEYKAKFKPTIVKSTAPRLKSNDGLEFRSWHYVTAHVKLSKQADPMPVCLNTGCLVTLIDRAFLASQSPNVKIAQMASPLSVRGIGFNKHSTSDYALVSIYIPGTNASGNRVKALITRKAHVVENLKAKMLIGMNIMGPESMDISVAKKEVYIGSCKTSSPINITARGQNIQRAVHAQRSIVIPPNSQIAVPVQFALIPESRDFLFEPAKGMARVALFAHIVDANMDHILARNDTNKPVTIRRQARLGNLAEIDYENCYHADSGVADLAVRIPRHGQQRSWVKKAFANLAALAVTIAAMPSYYLPPLTKEASAIQSVTTGLTNVQPVCIATTPNTSLKVTDVPSHNQGVGVVETPSSEITLLNEVTVHGNTNHIKEFAKLVDEYPLIW